MYDAWNVQTKEVASCKATVVGLKSWKRDMLQHYAEKNAKEAEKD